jgi:predicted HAD superfamily Cof-like phosphohydrolase
MRELQAMVAQFMHAGEQPIADYPCLPDDETRSLSMALIEEELQELKDAIKAIEGWHAQYGDRTGEDEQQDEREARLLARVADAQADLLYVVTWASLAWGFPIPLVMDEVQRANMDKFGPGSWKDENGKVRKPEGWEGPDLIPLMAKSCLSE